MNAKTCKQCGELKPIEQFRKYYGGRKGHYNTCKVCEKINARAKYLRNKGDEMNLEEEAELDKIYKLYDVQMKAGLQPPAQGVRRKPLVDNLDEMIAKYQAQVPAVPLEHAAEYIVTGEIPQKPIPAELQMWLKCELTEEPDYYLEEIYEELKAKYRPQLRIDTTTMQPVHDDTYKAVLEHILGRFYEYEETYWED